MERNPPPLFSKELSAHVRLLFFACLSIALLFIDTRFQTLVLVRQTVGTLLYPLQHAALWPRQTMRAVSDYFSSQTALQNENELLRQERVLNAQTLQGLQWLAEENTRLRTLLDLRQRYTSPALVTEVLYDTRDPYVRKIVVDKGLKEGVEQGQPVIDEDGVVGQVIRVFPLTAEVALLTDRDQTIPVQIVRNGLRAIAFGGTEAHTLELRFMAGNADIQNGDVLVTSGIDGLYPAGLAVGRIIRIEQNAASSFARVVGTPMGGINRHRHYLILQSHSALPPKPEPEPEPTATKRKKKNSQ
jgi:rod shape-determining protein MreC